MGMSIYSKSLDNPAASGFCATQAIKLRLEATPMIEAANARFSVIFGSSHTAAVSTRRQRFRPSKCSCGAGQMSAGGFSPKCCS